jgi:hypothetical protein
MIYQEKPISPTIIPKGGETNSNMTATQHSNIASTICPFRFLLVNSIVVALIGHAHLGQRVALSDT